jgi:hypothetical protein
MEFKLPEGSRASLKGRHLPASIHQIDLSFAFGIYSDPGHIVAYTPQ